MTFANDMKDLLAIRDPLDLLHRHIKGLVNFENECRRQWHTAMPHLRDSRRVNAYQLGQGSIVLDTVLAQYVIYEMVHNVRREGHRHLLRAVLVQPWVTAWSLTSSKCLLE